MKAIIMNYRGSQKEHHNKQMIIKAEGIDKRADAAKLVGKTATFTTQTGRKISGKVSSPHGNKGAVRVIFSEKGLPGQALGQKVDVD